ncbi:LLM class flavin-dependent oxidoreductase [Nisaea acidiphila]|uniref:Luciferase-like monooxygenase n=1 Tax=Nisaea acidiphila TaxID=1862145 RepID=A0A9J7AWW0_9PROT|nr:LLM class flavin-dependent oxidoreductase [Nisaea acidiphila]UUX51606.1 LLM class flavin-dependent oxidoreductase [Nisaea acidiphila]
MLRLSVLDQSVACAGQPEGEAILKTVAMAEHCERLGYHRFWVSEHHSHPTIVGSAPEMLLAAIAMKTERIRIGSAGVMLPHYAPLKVAEQFRILEALAPGRIDLGLGRAPGSDGRTSLALNPMAAERPAQFPNDVQELMAWVSGTPLPEDHPFAPVTARPRGETSPEVWMLGSSLYGAQVAAHFGLPYSFAWFFTDGQGGPEAIQIYRDRYQPSERFPEPNAGICVWALAAETEEEAQHHYSSRARWQLYRDRGRFTPLESPERAEGASYSETEIVRMDELRAKAMVGTGAQVAEKIRALAERLRIEEVAVVTWAYDEEARRRSYELIASEFGMTE